MAHAPDDYLLPVTYSRIVARVAQLPERKLSALLDQTGLPETILMPGDETYITGEQQLQILRNGRALLGSADFGLRLGHQLKPSSHGPMGYLALSSPDLLSSLNALRNYLPLRLPWVAIDVTLNAQEIVCEFRVRIALNDDAFIRITMGECFAMVMQSFVEAVLGRPAADAVIEFAHTAPAHAPMYEDYLHAPFSFDCSHTRYRLPAHLASTPNATGDNTSYRVTRELCDKLLEQTPRSLSSMADRVRTLMLLRPIESINEADVARSLFVSKRTLARRLEAEGTGYRQIREQFLEELARRYLLESKQTVETVAASLGYYDSAAFRKAFKRWTGLSPRSFRAAALTR